LDHADLPAAPPGRAGGGALPRHRAALGGLCRAARPAGDRARRGGPDLAALDGWSLQSIRALFASDAALVLGWIHYLAFDLFVGLWIARDADAKRFSRLAQAPVLAATFLAGPLGLFAWLAIRERRARASGRWQ